MILHVFGAALAGNAAGTASSVPWFYLNLAMIFYWTALCIFNHRSAMRAKDVEHRLMIERRVLDRLRGLDV